VLFHGISSAGSEVLSFMEPLACVNVAQVLVGEHRFGGDQGVCLSYFLLCLLLLKGIDWIGRINALIVVKSRFCYIFV
jgi:hypothetical protein